MVMAETSESGSCMGSGPGNIAAGKLIMASGSSYLGSCPPVAVHVET